MYKLITVNIHVGFTVNKSTSIIIKVIKLNTNLKVEIDAIYHKLIQSYSNLNKDFLLENEKIFTKK